MIYLIAWAIVCYRLAGLSTTSVLVIAIVPTLFLLLTAGFWETVGIKANGKFIMKKFLFSAMFLLSSFGAFAQQSVVIKAGTIVPLEALKTIRAAEVHEGETVDFKVSRDVNVDGKTVIPAGTLAKGTVYEAKRSTAFGTRGRLGIKLRYLTLPSGEQVSFTSSEVYIKGVNRTPLSVIIFCFTCLPFPCGGKAQMTAGYEVDATVASNTTVVVK